MQTSNSGKTPQGCISHARHVPRDRALSLLSTVPTPLHKADSRVIDVVDSKLVRRFLDFIAEHIR